MSFILGGGSGGAERGTITPPVQIEETREKARDKTRQRLAGAVASDTFKTSRRGALTPAAAIGKRLLGE